MSEWNLPAECKDPAIQQKYIESQIRNRELDLEAGLLGKIFGTKNGVINIAGIVLFVLIGVLIYSIVNLNSNSFFSTIFQVLTSMLTLVFGYLFGNSTSKN